MRNRVPHIPKKNFVKETPAEVPASRDIPRQIAPRIPDDAEQAEPSIYLFRLPRCPTC